MELTNEDNEYLRKLGYEDKDFKQIIMAMKVTTYKLDIGGRISRKRAIELLGRENFLSGISRSAFHYTAYRIVPETTCGMLFDSSRLFK